MDDAVRAKFKEMVTGLAEKVGADRCTLYGLDREKRQVWSVIALGLDDEIRLSINRGVLGAVARSGQTLNLKDVYNDPRFDRSVD